MHSVLAKEIDDCLAVLATPLEDGGPVRAAIGAASPGGKSRYQLYWGKNGMRRREYFGPFFESPRDAVRFCDQVNARTGLVGAGIRS